MFNSLRRGDDCQISGHYIIIMRDVEEYILKLDNLISNLQKLYKTSGPVELRTNKNILTYLRDLLELHKQLQLLMFNSKQEGVLALNDTNLISGIR